MTVLIPPKKVEDIDLRRSSDVADFSVHFTPEVNLFECRAMIYPEEEGGFSAVAIRLPGVVSQGETQEEAMRNLAEAFQGAMLSYRELMQPVPWIDRELPEVPGGEEKWIVVDVQ